MPRVLSTACYVCAFSALWIAAAIALPSLLRVCVDIVRVPFAGVYCARYAGALGVDSVVAALAACAAAGGLLTAGVVCGNQSN